MNNQFKLLYSRGLILISACVLAVSCVLSPTIPPEEFYARNYGDIERPDPQNPLESQQQITDQSADGGNEGTVFEVETQDVTADTIVTDKDKPDTSDDIEKSNLNNPVEVKIPGVLAELKSRNSQSAEKTPPYSPLVSDGTKPFNTIEQRLLYIIETSYKERNPHIFKNAYSQYLRNYPNSPSLAKVSDLNARFYFKEDLETGPFNNAIFDIGYLRENDYAMLDQYFPRAKQMGFEYILWKPFINIADYYQVPPPSKGEVGALYNSSIIQIYQDRMPRVLQSARDAGLKVLISFPLRDHPWVKYDQKRLPEETWFPGNSLYGMDALLNLLHPEVEDYLLELLRELIKFKVSGVVFENDFTHHMFEGFHELNLLVYEDQVYEDYLDRFSGRYNKNVQPRTFFRGNINNGRNNDFAYLKQVNSERYQKYVTWRVDRIGKTFGKLVSDLKLINKNLYIGVKTAPKLIVDRKQSIKVYGVAPEFIFNLPTDFIILNNGIYGTSNAGDYAEYLKSAEIMNVEVDKSKAVYLNSTSGKNTSIPLMNRNTEKIEELRHKISAKGLIIGNLLPYLRKEFSRQPNSENIASGGGFTNNQ